MTHKRTIARIAATMSVAALAAFPAFAAARGSADFTRLVAIGDSYGAGYESGSLNINHQVYAWPAVIAKQVGYKICAPTATATDACYALPLVSYPGLGPELTLRDLKGTITPAAGSGVPLMAGFGRPYNDLSVPGAGVLDVDTLTGAQPPNGSQARSIAPLVLRGLGTEVDQALAQHPTFITIWIGGNDVLLSALGGTDKAITPVAAFKTAYNAMLDKLVAGAPAAGIVVGTLPNSADAIRVPNFTTIPPVIVNPANNQPVIVNGAPVPYFGVMSDGSVGALPLTSKILLGAAADLRQGYGIPPALAAVPPFNQLPHAGSPLPDSDFLDPAEVASLLTAVDAYNVVIKDAAASHNVPVADIAGLFNRVINGHETVGPFPVSGAFVTGGFFSLDGFHLTDIGYTLFANEYIKAINAAYGSKVPLASISQFLTNNDPSLTINSGSSIGQALDYNNLTPEAVSQIRSMSSAPEPTPARRRGAVRHD